MTGANEGFLRVEGAKASVVGGEAEGPEMSLISK